MSSVYAKFLRNGNNFKINSKAIQDLGKDYLENNNIKEQA